MKNKKKRKKKQIKCANRESNPGHLVGNEVFLPLNYWRSILLKPQNKENEKEKKNWKN